MPLRLTPEQRAERFWSKVDKTGPCWIWNGAIGTHGYGRVAVMTNSILKVYGAHRVAWELMFGQIPDGAHVLHECDNPRCVNPQHLHLGTHAENMREMADRERSGRGFRKPNTLLSDKQAREIFASNESGRLLAKEYGVTEQTISAIRHGWIRNLATGAPKRRRS